MFPAFWAFNSLYRGRRWNVSFAVWLVLHCNVSSQTWLETGLQISLHSISQETRNLDHLCFSPSGFSTKNKRKAGQRKNYTNHRNVRYFHVTARSVFGDNVVTWSWVPSLRGYCLDSNAGERPLTVCPWANDLPSLSLICQTGILTVVKRMAWVIEHSAPRRMPRPENEPSEVHGLQGT